MSLVEIENKLKTLTVNINKNDFIFEFLLSYDQPKATIKRLIKGDYNLSKKNNQVIWKKKIFYEKIVNNEDVHDRIDDLSKDLIIEKNNIRFIIVTDFKSLLSIDTKTKQTLDIKILELHKYLDFFLPLTGLEKTELITENQADVKAAEKMGKLYDVIIKDNTETLVTKKDFHGLNMFFTRILFCFFAEDSDIFSKGLFTNSISSHTKDDGTDLDIYLKNLFEVLNKSERKNYPEYLINFPYVNGGLFKNEYKIPKFSGQSRKILIESGSLDWSLINPDILGSMMQAVVNQSDRKLLGMHYTSVQNILKVIKPLFLDELYNDLYNSVEDPKKLKTLLKKIYSIKIFDPACGSGNFLVITFKELCKIEIEIFKKLKKLDSNNWLIMRSAIKLTQFYGIEIDDYAHEAAKLSLWIAEHQMNVTFDIILGDAKPTLPLSTSGNIVCGNSLKLDWNKICPSEKEGSIFIIGNPPYVGSSMQSKDQKLDMSEIFKNINSYKNLDYISCWFFLAAKYIANTNFKVSFVSTSSITQGEQVALLWPHIFNLDLEISFAFKPFKWINAAKGKAGVTCIILGIEKKRKKNKFLYNEDNNARSEVSFISPYLLEIDPSIIVFRSNKQISNLPEMVMGNKPVDEGNLILSTEEYEKLVLEYPKAKKFIKKFLGSNELFKGIKRWCLWITDKEKDEALLIPFIKERVDRVKNFRLKSKAESTKIAAQYPHKFKQIQSNPEKAIIIPCVSSNRRNYLPIDFIDSDTSISNLGFGIYKPENYIFGIISSTMHIVWLRAVAGRFGEGFRYSSVLCYNSFVFPKIDNDQKKIIEQSVFNILNQREKFSEKNLSELYDPLLMPESLLKAHQELDIIVENCYSTKKFIDDESRLKYLFNLYKKFNDKNLLF